MGNPIHYCYQALNRPPGGENTLLTGDDRYSIWGWAHELGHDFCLPVFCNIVRMGGPGEAWPNIFVLYAAEMLGHWQARESRRWQAGEAYLVNGTYEQLRQNPNIALHFFRAFRLRYGWDFYRRFFAYARSFTRDQLPTDGGPKMWRWMLNGFSLAAGEDCTPIFEQFVFRLLANFLEDICSLFAL